MEWIYSAVQMANSLVPLSKQHYFVFVVVVFQGLTHRKYQTVGGCRGDPRGFDRYEYILPSSDCPSSALRCILAILWCKSRISNTVMSIYHAEWIFLYQFVLTYELVLFYLLCTIESPQAECQCCSPFCLLLHLPDYKPHNILNSLTLYVQHYLMCLIHICINYWPCNETEAYWFWLDHNNVFTLCFLYQNLEFIKTNKPFHGYVLPNNYGGQYNDKTIIQVDRGNIIYINHEFRI